MASNLRINQQRLWDSLMELAKIGATEKGGVCRLTLTDLDKQARDLFVKWCKEIGCSVSVDPIGNIFARRPGRNNDLPPIGTGSHIDTQPTGGKFDGCYGVMAGLEILRTLHDNNYETEAPIEISAWTNEEGSRFPPAMLGSGVFTGVFDLEYGLSRSAVDGVTVGEELKRIGYNGTAPMAAGKKGKRFGAFFEAHIEQGPILENEKKTIGIVMGAQGQRWFEINLTGQESHAGTTPMNLRRDALLGAARIIDGVNRIGLDNKPYAVATVGMVQVVPNSRNTIPGHVFLTIDLRNHNEAGLEKMGQALRDLVAGITKTIGLTYDLKQIWHSPTVVFDKDCVESVRNAATALGFDNMEIISGAGHDACYMSRIVPAGMVFVPCENGISHNEVENATAEDLAAGCNVLMQAMLERANATVK